MNKPTQTKVRIIPEYTFKIKIKWIYTIYTNINKILKHI
jgi:hypothetical protein